MKPHSIQATVYADYGQFLLEDAAFDGDISEVWDGGALARHLGVLPGVIAVGTGMQYGNVPIRVELGDDEPDEDVDEWDHVVDAGIEAASGTFYLLHVLDPPTPSSPALLVPPGEYRARVRWSRLDTSDHDEPEESYFISLWPGTVMEPEVRKWWPPWRGDRVTAWPTSGRLIIGAEAWDAKNDMRVIAEQGYPGNFLYEGKDGTRWEHGYKDGVPFLEELNEEQVKERFGKGKWYRFGRR